MSLMAQAKIAQDMDLIQRVSVSAAVNGAPDSPPTGWALREIWALSASDGWVYAYESCVNARPGSCPDSITDAMIHDAVQGRIAQIETERPQYPDDPDPAD